MNTDRGRKPVEISVRYIHRLLLLAVLLFLPLGCAGDIAQVSVLDMQLHPMKVITTGDELARFKMIWLDKEAADPVKVRWEYLLDISTETRGDRWRYHPEGWVQMLSVKHAKTYKVRSARDFNELLGIQHRKLDQDAP